MSDNAAWQDRLPFLQPRCITHEVLGSPERFYTISTGFVFRLKGIARPMAKALTALFENQDKDFGHAERQVQSDQRIKTEDGQEVPTVDREVIVEPISMDLAQLRYKQRQQAVEEIVDALTDAENRAVIGEIIMDCLAEKFPREKRRDNPPGDVFLNTVPLDAIPDLIMGVAKANEGVLGPLGSKLARLKDQIGQQLDARLAERLTVTPRETPGETSPTPSSTSPATGASTLSS